MKFKTYGAGQIHAHIERTRQEGHYGNENIDSSRTHLNYDIEPYSYFDKFPHIKAIVEAKQGKALRKDAVGSVGVVVQIPKAYKGCITDAQLQDFFQAVHDILLDTFGNCCWASVHMDETTPHLHFGFIPYHADNQTLRVDNILSKKFLKQFHGKVDEALKERLPWYRGGLVAENKIDTLKSKDNLKIDEYKMVCEETDKLKSKNAELSKKLGELSNATTLQAQVNTELKARSVSPSIIEKVEQGKHLKRAEKVELLTLATKGIQAQHEAETLKSLQRYNEGLAERLREQKRLADEREETQNAIEERQTEKDRILKDRTAYLNQYAKELEQEEKDNTDFLHENLQKEANLQTREQALEENESRFQRMAETVKLFVKALFNSTEEERPSLLQQAKDNCVKLGFIRVYRRPAKGHER